MYIGITPLASNGDTFPWLREDLYLHTVPTACQRELCRIYIVYIRHASTHRYGKPALRHVAQVVVPRIYNYPISLFPFSWRVVVVRNK